MIKWTAVKDNTVRVFARVGSTVIEVKRSKNFWFLSDQDGNSPVLTKIDAAEIFQSAMAMFKIELPKHNYKRGDIFRSRNGKRAIVVEADNLSVTVDFGSYAISGDSDYVTRILSKEGYIDQ